MTRMPNRWLWSGLLGSVLVILILYYGYRFLAKRAMMENYQRANSSLPAADAVENLAKFQDARATRLLLRVAQNPDAFPQNREFAILALAKRGDGTITDSLAELLRPGEALAIQLAIVGPLLDRDCQRQCIRFLIRYFDRLYNGEPMPHPVSPSSDVNQGLEADGQEILRLARELLTNNKNRTLETLRDEYGLGSANPSAFAPRLLRDLHMVKACPLLTQSKGAVPKSDKPLSPDVQSAIDSLECEHYRRTT